MDQKSIFFKFIKVVLIRSGGGKKLKRSTWGAFIMHLTASIVAMVPSDLVLEIPPDFRSHV